MPRGTLDATAVCKIWLGSTTFGFVNHISLYQFNGHFTIEEKNENVTRSSITPDPSRSAPSAPLSHNDSQSLRIIHARTNTKKKNN